MDKTMEFKSSLSSRPRPDATEAVLELKKEMMKIQIDYTHDDHEDYRIAQNTISSIRHETGITTDEIMMKHNCIWDNQHPESPIRINCIINRLTELGLLQRCKKVESRKANENEICEVHSKDLVEILKSTNEVVNAEYLEKLSSKFQSIYLNRWSYQAAITSAGCSLSLVEEICQGTIQNGFAIIRPPGHQASANEYRGYCFFNNAAIAAELALEKFEIKKVLIVDWDVHHGRGIQETFYEDPRVLYFSIHRREEGNSLLPKVNESNFDCIGENQGKGYNVNVPLSEKGAKDADYMAIFHQLLLPMAYEFQPRLVIICAGFDAALGCPQGELELTPSCFAHFTHLLMGLAEGKVAVLLEGGYCQTSLAESAAMTLRALLGDPIPELSEYGTPMEQTVEVIRNVMKVHQPYWKCLLMLDDSETIKEHEVIGERLETGPSEFETRRCYPTYAPEKAEELEMRLRDLIAGTNLSVPYGGVLLAYDESMTEHENLSGMDVPEKPDRIKYIYRKHEEFGLTERCKKSKSRYATQKELLMVHSEKYVRNMRQLYRLSKEEFLKKEKCYQSVFLHPKSFACASLAAGMLLQMVDDILQRSAKCGIAIVRPPGRHAQKDAACGFCIFNNVSLAAKYAIEQHGIKKVLILDWNVDHGSGIQKIFEADDKVLCISVHRYDHSRFFPNSEDGNYDKVGIAEGEGYNINIPWNKMGGGLVHADYLLALFYVVLPVAYEFQPELIIVSAGFGACINDSCGNCKLSPQIFAHMSHILSGLANGKIILSLEGGCNLESISYSMTLCTKSLLGDPIPLLSTEPLEPVSPNSLQTIKNVINIHKKYWRCFQLHK